jgi:uncharacterized protein YjiS (DUF1127 family)
MPCGAKFSRGKSRQKIVKIGFLVKSQLLKLCISCIAAAQHYCFSCERIPLFCGQPDSPAASRNKRKRIIMFAAIVRFIREWKRYNRSLSELSRLGDRELADIGISRSDIPQVAWNATHRG